MGKLGYGIVWQFWAGHRWSLCLTLLAAVSLPLIVAWLPVDRGEARAALAMPLGAAALLLFAVFSHGFQADLLQPQSGYPRRMFTLPVSSHQLVAWPMLLGTVSLASMWLVVALGILRPSGVPVPLWWPAACIAAMAALAQAISWSPFGWPGLRILVAVPVLCVVSLASFVLLIRGHSPTLVLMFYLSLLPVAYVWALHGVAKARRGGGKERSWELLALLRPARRRPFGSPLMAQLWYERRKHGLMLPIMVACCVIPLVGISWYAEPQAIGTWLLVFALLPVIYAGVGGSPIDKIATSFQPAYGLPAFVATRPLDCQQLVRAKLIAAAATAAIALMSCMLGAATALFKPVNWQAMTEVWQRVPAEYQGWKGVVTVVVVMGLLLLVTWKRLVQNLFIGLSGRAWLVNTSVVIDTVLITLVTVQLLMVSVDRSFQLTTGRMLPWLLGGLLAAKFLLASLAMWLALRRGAMSRQQLMTGLGAWTVTVLAVLLASLAIWPNAYWPLNQQHWFYLAIGVLLLVPLARLILGPTALHWNRHR